MNQPNTPENNKWIKRLIRIGIVIMFITFGILFGFYYSARFWSIGSKQTAGDLQSFGSDGRLIITFEGRLLTNELMKDDYTGIAERVLRFSAEKGNDSLITFLNSNVGKRILIKYRKYEKPFIWRGQSQYIVYEAKPIP